MPTSAWMGRSTMPDLQLTEDKGALRLDADYNSDTQAYRADLAVDSLQLQHFLPKDSIYELSLSVAARGRGTRLYFAQSHRFAQSYDRSAELYALSPVGRGAHRRAEGCSCPGASGEQ